MFACICRAVTRDQVETAIDDGAVTVTAVARATGACTGCGTCLERIAGLIDQRTQPCPLAALAASAPHAVTRAGETRAA